MGLANLTTVITTLSNIIGFIGIGASIGVTAAVVGLLGVFDMLKNKEQGYTNFIQRWVDKWELLGNAIDRAFDALVRWTGAGGEVSPFAAMGSGFGGGSGGGSSSSANSVYNTTNYGGVSVNLPNVTNPEAFARQLASAMRRRKL